MAVIVSACLCEGANCAGNSSRGTVAHGISKGRMFTKPRTSDSGGNGMLLSAFED
jgi:hypothetical protein